MNGSSFVGTLDTVREEKEFEISTLDTVREEIKGVVSNLDTVREEKNLLCIPGEIINTQRLTILILLHTHGYLDFTDLKNTLDITEGSLASHLKSLEKIDLVKSQKEFEDKKPKTVYYLSTEGDKRFVSYLEILKRTIDRYE